MERDEIREFGNLVDAADLGRDRCVSTLCELRQRLLTSGPVNDMPTLPVMTTVPPEAANASAPADVPKGGGADSSSSSSRQQKQDSEAAVRRESEQQFRKAPPKKHKTWTRDFGTAASTATSGEEDATSGAEQGLSRAKRTGSLLSMFKHRKHGSKENNTNSPGSNNNTPPQAVDAPEQGPQPVSPTSMPFRPFRPNDSREVSPTSTGRPHQPPANRSNNYFNFAPEHGGLAESKESESHLSEAENSRPTSPGGTSYIPTGALSPATQMSSLSNAPPMVRGHASSTTLHSQAPSSTNLAAQNTNTTVASNRTNTTSNSSSRAPSQTLPHPTPENHYLGFCKSAVKLQNNDRSALLKRKEFSDALTGDTHHTQFLACASSKCCFAGRLDLQTIWDKVFHADKLGVKFRWQFLAKSHVQQKYMKEGKYGFQCLFCTYAGEPRPPVLLGTDKYLGHVSEVHRVKAVSEQVAKRCRAVVERVAGDEEGFDVCLAPLERGEELRKKSWQGSETVKGLGGGGGGVGKSSEESKGDSVVDGGGGHWNEGLSDFHYGGDFEYRGEI